MSEYLNCHGCVTAKPDATICRECGRAYRDLYKGKLPAAEIYVNNYTKEMDEDVEPDAIYSKDDMLNAFNAGREG